MCATKIKNIYQKKPPVGDFYIFEKIIYSCVKVFVPVMEYTLPDVLL